MKVNDILLENENNIDGDDIKTVIESSFFQTYYKPILDKIYNELKDNYTMHSFVNDAMVEIDRVSLFHGSYGKKAHFGIYDFNYRKNPKDTDKLVHGYVNHIAKEKIGEPVRNLIFVSRSSKYVEDYGSIYYFIPLDNVEYYYNPFIDDFTAVYQASSRFLTFDISDEISKNINMDDINFNIRRNLIPPIHLHIQQHGFNGFEDIETLILNRLQPFKESIREEIKNAVINTISNKLSKSYDEYVDNIVKTSDHTEIPKNIEIMVKTSRFAFIKLGKMKNILRFYFINYLSKE